MRKRLILSVLLVLSALTLRAQEQDREPSDSLVRLIYAESGKIEEIDGEVYRQFIGSARFFHNNTYLLCDTALWNVDRRIIQALGHVQVFQEQTYLTSQRADYLIDEDLAQFRGSLVELYDKDNNILRTRHLDYNTKDSVAVFQGGGAMRDKDGQVIESREGTYDSKAKTFTFTGDVNMFSDTTFIKTTRIVYRSDDNMAFFGTGTDLWQDEDMLSADDGWYDRGHETFFFRDRVHVMTPTQEGWCDSLYVYRDRNIVEMLGRAELRDTTRGVTSLAGRIRYVDSLSRVTMTRAPAVVAETGENGQRDTVWFAADTLSYWTERMCDIAEGVRLASEARQKELSQDAVTAYRQKAAEAARKAAEEAAKNDPDRPPGPPVLPPPDTLAALSDTLRPPLEDFALPDTLRTLPRPDSLARVPADSLAVPADTLTGPLTGPLDTTRIGFVTAFGHVRMFRADMQVTCGRLYYSDLDSLARLFDDPIVWNDGNRQYTADSISVVIVDERADRAHLLSSGFIITQETEAYYDQIRGTELVAYFASDNSLRRFDALGGANAIFYLKENDAFATVNKVDAKMLYAEFKDGELDRIFYFDSPKNDAYPIVQLPAVERELKGFRWRPELRPADRRAITARSLRPLERRQYAAHPRADYRETKVYFPGYMDKIYTEIARRDSLEAARARLREASAPVRDPLAVPADSLLALSDTLDRAELRDTLAAPVADSLGVFPADSLVSAAADTLAPPPDAAALRKAEAERRRAERLAAREARWAAQDARDAEKARIKVEKKLARERKAKLRELRRLEKRAQKEQRALERYKARYERQKAREDAKKGRHNTF